MTASTGKSQNPAYPDAHPTAPGGMSREALINELVEKHGFEGDNAAWAQVKWPVLIDMVIEERKAREAREAEQTPDEMIDLVTGDDQTEAEDYLDEQAEPTHTAEPDDFEDDLDALLAEFYDEQITEAVERPIDSEALIQQAIEADTDDDAEALLLAASEASEAYEDEGVLDPETMFAEMVKARTEHEATLPPPVFIGLPVVKDYIFDGHAGAGPSGAERWMNCTMSLSASREFLETLSPNQQATFAQSGTAARQGTTAHAAAEAEANLILGRATVEEVEHTLLELSLTTSEVDEAYDDEMAEYITEYVDLVKSYAQDRGDEHVLVEARVEAAIPLTDLHEGDVYVIRGSADTVVLPVNTKGQRSLVVGDLKYGNGIDVDVDENPQIRIYALGVLELLVDDEGNLPDWLTDVTYHIVQPRLGGIKTWTESIDALLEWRDEVLAPALTKALYGVNEGATYQPSELACQFCPARGRCPALTQARVEAAGGLFDAIVESEFEGGSGSFPETTSLTDTQLGEYLSQITGLIDLHKDLKAEAQRRLMRGEDVPGYWLVNYSPNRHWDEGATEALAEIEEVWTEPKLVTPAAAEKALGKEAFSQIEALVVKPDKVPLISTGPKDRRKRWEGRPPEAMFPDDADESGEEA